VADHPYEVWDVFTDRPLSGNPLAVVRAEGLDPGLMQGIAAEFGFSETSFVLPPEDGGTARVRIFTPRQEIPFAGHPTIGTALALADHGPELTLELGIGPVPVTLADGRASLRNTTPLLREFEVAPETVAACAGLGAPAVRLDTHAPVRAGVGLPFVLAELADADALAAARPVADAFREAEQRHDGPFHFTLLLYVREGDRVRARVFAPLDGIPEDPATGSAACALAALLGETLGRDLALDIRQGDEMGRPSRIEAAAEIEAGRCVATRLTGGAVKVMEGRLCGF
jgi:trans-2,3-dihydro-3-hydroxyanthranilate isomerase